MVFKSLYYISVTRLLNYLLLIKIKLRYINKYMFIRSLRLFLYVECIRLI